MPNHVITELSYPPSPAAATRGVVWRFGNAQTNANVIHLRCEPVIDGIEYPSIIIEQNAELKFELDLSGMIQDRFASKAASSSPSYGLPALGTAAGTSAENPAGYVYAHARVYEVYDDYWESDNYLQSTTIYALNAARQFNESQALSAYVAGSAAAKFLTYAPRTRTVLITDSIFLSIYAENPPALLKGTIFYKDNTTLGISEAVGFLNTNLSLLYPAGPANLAAAGMSMPNVSHYTVYLAALDDGNPSTSEVMSETFTFYVDSGAQRVRKTIFWENPLGGIDTYTFTGDYQTRTRAEYPSYQSHWSLVTAKDHANRTLRPQVQVEHTLSSDYINRETSIWLNTLLESKRVWVQEGNSYIAIQLLGMENMRGQYTNSLHRVEVKFTYAESWQTLRS